MRSRILAATAATHPLEPTHRLYICECVCVCVFVNIWVNLEFLEKTGSSTLWLVNGGKWYGHMIESECAAASVAVAFGFCVGIGVAVTVAIVVYVIWNAPCVQIIELLLAGNEVRFNIGVVAFPFKGPTAPPCVCALNKCMQCARCSCPNKNNNNKTNTALPQGRQSNSSRALVCLFAFQLCKLNDTAA